MQALNETGLSIRDSGAERVVKGKRKAIKRKVEIKKIRTKKRM